MDGWIDIERIRCTGIDSKPTVYRARNKNKDGSSWLFFSGEPWNEYGGGGSVAKLCLTLVTPMDCSPPGSSVHRFFRPEYRSALPFPSPEDFLCPGIEPASPVLQAVSRMAGRFFPHWRVLTQEETQRSGAFQVVWHPISRNSRPGKREGSNSSTTWRMF